MRTIHLRLSKRRLYSIISVFLVGLSITGLVAMALANTRNSNTWDKSADVSTPSQAAQVKNEPEPAKPTSSVTPVSTGETCSQRSIPYTTSTRYNATQLKDTDYSFGGYNGTEYYCISANGVKRVTATVPPIDKIINVGTAELYTYTPPPTSTSTTPATTPKTYEQAANYCRGAMPESAYDSSAWQQCITAYLSQ